jgi:hypothetical protein
VPVIGFAPALRAIGPGAINRTPEAGDRKWNATEAELSIN